MKTVVAMLLVLSAATARADSGPEVTLDVGTLPWSLLSDFAGPSLDATFGWRLRGHAFGLGLSGDHTFAPTFPSLGVLGYYRTPALYSSGRFALAAGAEAIVLAPSGGGCMRAGDKTFEAPSPLVVADVDATWRVGWLRAGLELAEGGFVECGQAMIGLPGASVVLSYAPDWDRPATERSRDGAGSWRPYLELGGLGGFSVAPWRSSTSAPLSPRVPESAVTGVMLSADLGTDAFRAGLRFDAPTFGNQSDDINGITGYAHAVATVWHLPAGFRSEAELGVGIAKQPAAGRSNVEPAGIVSLRFVRPFGLFRPAIALSEIVQGSGPFASPIATRPPSDPEPRTTVLGTVISLSLGASLGDSRG